MAASAATAGGGGRGFTGAGRARLSLNVVPITAFIMVLSSAVLESRQPRFHAAEGHASSLCVRVCVHAPPPPSILISAASKRSSECEDGPSGWELLLVKM